MGMLSTEPMRCAMLAPGGIAARGAWEDYGGGVARMENEATHRILPRHHWAIFVGDE